MDIVNFSDFRKNLASCFNWVAENDDTLIVTSSKKRKVVLISLESYNSLVETMHLLSSPANNKRLLDSRKEAKKGKIKKSDLDSL